VSFPARLHALLARDAPVGVVFRRGPSRLVCSILWKRDTDEFQIGQWLGGRIYERRADISPDGRHMIYFAMNGKWTPESRGSWTAVSRAPWLKAVVFVPWGNCWLGGGLFTSNRKFWVNGGACHDIPGGSGLAVDADYKPQGSYGAECPSVYYRRLQRDGWTLRENMRTASEGLAIFEKPLPSGWTLRKYAHSDVDHPKGTGCYWDTHEIEDSSGRRIERKKWEWAELDRGSLVWAEGGCLFRAGVSEDGPGEARMLFDFNPLKFEAREAPY
jgi:hypothetical protein